ncbi:LacI family DNA-binding transcriptional regulator [Fictibacillus enclensis]|uniref:LacI family DNA-binding transcriptional regulator n=1 Tax=Fictibacillus enclensis TaxID=1017270 RepID=UPI0024C016C7|nr:LacI family DNA-binding transcriptional regulator [Fictibacillus enclensis]WHY72672.1 LacI family DNA-binding transcriptional regulator [Fictibacillus enclensis]
MTSMKEVARKADVSVATVSAVINNNKFVSEELRERIEAAIKELNYRPNRFAQGLKGKKTKLIGVFVTELTNPFYPNMLKQLEEMAFAEGYNLIMSTTGDDEKKELKLFESLMDLKVDGLVLATVDNRESKLLYQVEQENIPYVLINRAPSNFEMNKVCVDSFKVGQLATSHLLSLNHQRIAFIGGNRQNSVEREAGYRNTLENNGIEVNEELIFNAEYNVDQAYAVAKKLMRLKDRPSAIFAASDTMAYGVIKACLDEGLKVPEDLSVMGSDNIPHSEDFRVPLSTVDVHGSDIGAKGFELLHSNLESKETFEPQQVIIEPSLIIRESTAEKK